MFSLLFILALLLRCHAPTQHSIAMVTDADRANLIAYVRSHASRIKNPSRRTPVRETIFNNADNVERQLQEDGHKILG